APALIFYSFKKFLSDSNNFDYICRYESSIHERIMFQLNQAEFDALKRSLIFQNGTSSWDTDYFDYICRYK
ncbi:MAG: hypothetical protein NC421_06685, partial [Lachnospiraceae bacterium]|nr:hypothetical protein [Lachnospiraceae bacterium]